ncbi:MAG: polymer-forming cytoskeletal protein [Gammaproteobacteria bacterium]|jgi:cytoskeletal protein CcmA (bactofilin family)|nr:polymer-forming cytoskeletal protein [Pseudomonadales bacterium]MCS5580160.1 polymer-forming cytoskeletal protein [Gammaproteobacteria bacterium]MEE2608103.1 polymer-forming cytoskeletal protein [Pseudomonadota bacterium]HAC87362.1 cell shape-determining protein CcmA [Gammaproteobacteria bacterium]HAD72373.1 cell shape-determining protein CcmA [Gammaproteobacteria bacterium]|tara:strand:- start:1275 stop:1736 length:462 start_codon:yes stop_codon:yes gene_type:complete
MFSKFANNTDDLIHTLVSRTTEFVGDIHFSGELIIEGRVKGKIYADDDSSALIRVGEKGVVEGEICVPTAIINGLVQGDIRSATRVELAAKAVVLGNVYYKTIEMVMGSEVNGNLKHIGINQHEPNQVMDDKNFLTDEELTALASQTGPSEKG